MTFGNDGWTLDLDRLAAAITPTHARALRHLAVQPDRLDRDARRSARAARARAPARPLDHRRRDLCALLVRRGRRARPPSTTSWTPDDRILFVNTFSKNWAMTGWRIGWIAAHPGARPGDREPDPVFDLRRRAVHAARRRRGARARRRASSRIRSSARGAAATSSATRSAATGRVPLRAAGGRVLSVLPVDGETDTRRLGLRLVDEAASGWRRARAFGAGGERFLRCASRATPSSSRRRSGASPRCCRAHR